MIEIVRMYWGLLR